jgi:hypothetical protein
MGHRCRGHPHIDAIHNALTGVVGDLSNVVFEASTDTLMLLARSRARLTPGREDHCQGGNALGGVDGYAADVG